MKMEFKKTYNSDIEVDKDSAAAVGTCENKISERTRFLIREKPNGPLRHYVGYAVIGDKEDSFQFYECRGNRKCEVTPWCELPQYGPSACSGDECNGDLGFRGCLKWTDSVKEGEKTTPKGEPYRATLSGTYICLPHVNSDGPQTMECALGLETADGKYYSLDFGQLPAAFHTIKTGQYITGNGVVTPVERLSSDHWRKYPIVGIFTVTDSLKINPK